MDGLDEFEKTLAAEKAERERASERSSRKHKHDKNGHRHHHHRRGDGDGDRDDDRDGRHRSSRRRHDDNDGDRHRHKRSRHDDRDEDEERDRSGRRRNHRRDDDGSGERKLPREEGEEKQKLVRDDWMTTPSALGGTDYHTKRSAKQDQNPPPSQSAKEPQRAIHSRELNATHLEDLNMGRPTDAGEAGEDEQDQDEDKEDEAEVDYRFGDAGAQWRMTKLKGVYTTAETTGRPVDEVALERFGSLREFDDAREERIELDRCSTYGEGYMGKEKPSGDLFRGRKRETGSVQPQLQPQLQPQHQQPASTTSSSSRIDQTMLNKLRAQMLKAELRKSPGLAKLQAEYKAAVSTYQAQGPESNTVVVMQNRMLAGTRGEAKAVDTRRGRERGTLEENDDMTIDDMVREERRTRVQEGGEGRRMAERIAKDSKFDTNLDYQDDNAAKLARRIHQSEINLRSSAISDFQKQSRILDSCPLCHHDDNPSSSSPQAPVVSLATRTYLTLPTLPEISEGGALIVPITHRQNLLHCDDDEWDEVRNFMKSLTRLYHDQGRDVVFYENAAHPPSHRHAALHAVPIPWDMGATAPAFFKEAILAADEEWSQHRKLIDTGKAAREGGMGKLAFRRSLAKEMPYFHVWFSIDGGLGHVVEDEGRWPKGDLFARGVLGGMLDIGEEVVRKRGRWGGKEVARVEEWRKRWRPFDWTRVLVDA